jgi:hypothetical protein
MEKTHAKIYLIVLAASILLLILALVFFYKPFYLYRPAHRFWSTHSHRTLGVNDVNMIQSWMTFNYINKVFKLPTNYLKNTLNISDSRYPNIPLEDYAEKAKIKTADFTTKVQDAVHSYLTHGK